MKNLKFKNIILVILFFSILVGGTFYYFNSKGEEKKEVKKVKNKDIKINSNDKINNIIKPIEEKKETSYIINIDNTKIEKNIEKVYQIGDQSKMFTTVIVYKLIEEGKINLSTKLKDIYKNNEFSKFNYDNFSNLTIKNLLLSNTRINDYLELKNDKNLSLSKDKLISKLSKYSKDEFSIQNLKKMLQSEVKKQHRITKELGSVGYSSRTNFYILADICEKVSKQNYSNLLKSLIFDKLKMTKTSINNKSLKNKLNSKLLKGSYDITSSAKDMKAFLNAIVNKDQVIMKKDSFNKMFKDMKNNKLDGNGFKEVIKNTIGSEDLLNLNNHSMSSYNYKNKNMIIMSSKDTELVEIVELLNR